MFQTLSIDAVFQRKTIASGVAIRPEHCCLTWQPDEVPRHQHAASVKALPTGGICQMGMAYPLVD